MYLFIARKPGDDFYIDNNLTAKELVRKWAEYLVCNMEKYSDEDDYEFYIFKNGINLYNEYGINWDGGGEFTGELDQETATRLSKQEEMDKQEIDELSVAARLKAENMKRDKDNEEQRRLEEDAIRQQSIDKERRQKLYEKLKAEFAPN